MEFILKDINIFDESIYNAFDKLVKANINKFNENFPYIVSVSFGLNIENSSESRTLIKSLLAKANTKNKHSNIKSEALSIQIDKIKKILNTNGIKTFSLNIQGENLVINNSVKIKFEEDRSNPLNKINVKKQITVVGIIPNIHNTTEKMAKLKSERMSKIFDDFMDIIMDKKIMAEILDICPTDDTNKLYMSFVEQYGELWFTTNEREKELLNHLKEKSLSVLDKYYKRNT